MAEKRGRESGSENEDMDEFYFDGDPDYPPSGQHEAEGWDGPWNLDRHHPKRRRNFEDWDEYHTGEYWRSMYRPPPSHGMYSMPPHMPPGPGMFPPPGPPGPSGPPGQGMFPPMGHSMYPPPHMGTSQNQMGQASASVQQTSETVQKGDKDGVVSDKQSFKQELMSEMITAVNEYLGSLTAEAPALPTEVVTAAASGIQSTVNNQSATSTVVQPPLPPEPVTTVNPPLPPPPPPPPVTVSTVGVASVPDKNVTDLVAVPVGQLSGETGTDSKTVEDKDEVLEEGEVMVDDVSSSEAEYSGEDMELGQYRRKVKKVRDMFGLPAPEMKKTGSLSIEGMKKGKYLLPHKSDYATLFSEYMDQVRGTKDKKAPLEQEQFPPKFTPKMGLYEVEDCPWSVEDLKVDSNLYSNETLWSSADNPQLRVPSRSLKHWETSNRESMSIASYTENFIWASQERLRNMFEKLDSRRYANDPTLKLKQIENLAQDVTQTLDFLQSAAIGLKDMVKMTVDRIGSQVLVRRDTWLNVFPKCLPKAERLQLRHADLNGKHLFGEELVDKAKEAVSKQMRDKVNNKFLTTAMPHAQSTSQTSGKKNDGREDKHGSFRGKKTGGKQKNDKLWARENEVPKYEFKGQGGSRGRGNRGGGSRGRGTRGKQGY